VCYAKHVNGSSTPFRYEVDGTDFDGDAKNGVLWCLGSDGTEFQPDYAAIFCNGSGWSSSSEQFICRTTDG